MLKRAESPFFSSKTRSVKLLMRIPSVNKGRHGFRTPSPRRILFRPLAVGFRYAYVAAPHPARALKSEYSEDLEGRICGQFKAKERRTSSANSSDENIEMTINPSIQACLSLLTKGNRSFSCISGLPHKYG